VLRRWPLPLAAALLLAVPASAADQSVRATPGNDFEPADVTIDPGDTVTWTNGGGFHNVKFDDGSFEEPASPDFTQWTVDRTFDAPGTFRYYCEAHGGPSGEGMAGVVRVRDATGSVPQPPGLTVAAPAEQRLRRVLRRGVRARTTCENGCEARFEVSLSARTAKRFGFRRRRTTIGTATASLGPGTATNVDIALTERAKRRLRGAERPFRLRLDVTATRDTPETARRTIEIKP
jgi:plastocyanin